MRTTPLMTAMPRMKTAIFPTMMSLLTRIETPAYLTSYEAFTVLTASVRVANRIATRRPGRMKKGRDCPPPPFGCWPRLTHRHGTTQERGEVGVIPVLDRLFAKPAEVEVLGFDETGVLRLRGGVEAHRDEGDFDFVAQSLVG